MDWRNFLYHLLLPFMYQKGGNTWPAAKYMQQSNPVGFNWHRLWSSPMARLPRWKYPQFLPHQTVHCCLIHISHMIRSSYTPRLRLQPLERRAHRTWHRLSGMHCALCDVQPLKWSGCRACVSCLKVHIEVICLRSHWRSNKPTSLRVIWTFLSLWWPEQTHCAPVPNKLNNATLFNISNNAFCPAQCLDRTFLH